MSNELTDLNSRPPFSEEELLAYRLRLKSGLFRQLRALFRRRKAEEGLTQKELARRLNTDEALISKRLRGETNLTVDTLCDLARGMGARIDFKVTPLSEVANATSSATTSRALCTLVFQDEVTKALVGQKAHGLYTMREAKWLTRSGSDTLYGIVYVAGFGEYRRQEVPQSEPQTEKVAKPDISWVH
jgi:transcriptional regulator with XRE-family HTH domain